MLFTSRTCQEAVHHCSGGGGAEHNMEPFMIQSISELTGKTKVLGIIGDPISHSLSPLMQNAALRALGLDYIYVPFRVRPEELSTALLGLQSLNIVGFNVTIPHKTAVTGLVDGLSREAELIGAVNTVTREGAHLIGHNTDAIGFLSALTDGMGFDPSGANVLLLGAGGAARAALVALSQAGIERITIANRTQSTAEELLDLLRRTGSRASGNHASLATVCADRSLMGSFDLVVNTTSVGMGGTAFANFDVTWLNPGARIYDMVYVPSETPLLQAARAAGITAMNGASMLAAQGEAAFRLWIGCDPPPGLMRERVLAALAALS